MEGRNDLKAYHKLRRALTETTADFLDRKLPMRRIVLVASLLKNCNIEIPGQNRLFKCLQKEQKTDGGWVDCEDTAWAAYFLSGQRDFETNVKKGLDWLESERCDNKGWGFCKRDNSCIPITSQVLYLLPHLSQNHEAVLWLENEWERDLHSPINLNYKAAWYLLACATLQSKGELSGGLVYDTVHYLTREQREDGGWGPWKNHPAPSDCFITGICLASLALFYQKLKNDTIMPSLIKGMEWIQRKQLKSGLFPTHYIEEGSAWLFWGWNKTLKAIEVTDL